MAFGDPITGGETVADDLITFISKFVPDKEKAAEMANELQEKYLSALQATDQAQAAVDQQEAQNTNWFIAGWRPGLGWICDLGIGMNFIVFPTVSWFCAFVLQHPVPMPNLNIAELITLVTLLLGGHTARTIEKIYGVST